MTIFQKSLLPRKRLDKPKPHQVTIGRAAKMLGAMCMMVGGHQSRDAVTADAVANQTPSQYTLWVARGPS